MKVKDRTACMPPDLSCPCIRRAAKPPLERPRRGVTADVYKKADGTYTIRRLKKKGDRGWSAKFKWRRKKRREGSVNDDLTQRPHGDNYLLSCHTLC